MTASGLRQRHAWGLIGVHWLTLLLIVAAYVLGSVLEDMALSPAKLQLYAWHKWLGMLVLFSVPVRLLLRLLDRLPADPSLLSWEAKASAATHIVLYALLAAVPLSGWLQSSAEGFPVVLFTVWQLPDLVGKDAALAETLGEAHEVAVNLLVWLAGLHTAAALYHHYLKGDAVLRRMAPWLRPRT